MTNNAVPSPPRTDAGNAGRRCPDDLWALGEKAVARARRWADESASEPVPRSAKLLSRILSDPEGLTFTTRFVDDVVRPTDLDVAIKYARAIRTDNYAIEATDDETGVEICAPMKNVFAIALGIADGLQEKTGVPHHNLKAATFNEAVREMSILGTSQGANEMTAFGLPGVGDLEVTGLSGRNKFYGVRIGRGEGPKEALEEMARLEQTVEGVPAAGLALKFVEQHAPELRDQLPLMNAVIDVLSGEVEDVKTRIGQAVLPARP